MADEKRDAPKPLPGEENFDPDDYIRTAVFYGRLDVVKDWLPHQRGDPGRVSELVLCPAAMYGQLEVLRCGLDYGDVHYTEQCQPRYLGWSLMHFAVEGIHMNVPSEDNQQENQRGTQESVLLSMQEVHGRLLDIVALLLSKGVEPAVPDRQGHTPADKASSITSREECFLDGAILLDIHVCKHVDSAEQAPKTPGLETVKKLQKDLQWPLALQPLIEWAYSRQRYDVMVFCHRQQLVDLTQQSMSLSTSYRPLMIDIIRTEKYSLFHQIIWSIPERERLAYVQKILMKVYEYGSGNLGKWSESLLSYACRQYTNHNTNIFPSLLSADTLGCQLTHIRIENVSLAEVPLPVFSAGLTQLDLSKNGLTSLPVAEALRQGLCERLEVLNIAANAFTEVPEDVFRLPRLTKLDARSNQIATLPEAMWTAPHLEDIYLSKNHISSLPCPDFVLQDSNAPSLTPSHVHVSFSDGLARSTTSDMLQLMSARHAYLIPASPDTCTLLTGFRLKLIDLSGNQLSQVPWGLPCLAPLLKVLKLSGNRITHLGLPCNYPPLLENLDVSRNGCERCIQWCPRPPGLVCTQAQMQGRSRTCAHFNHTVFSNLKFLYLQNNRLTNMVLEGNRNREEGGEGGQEGGERDEGEVGEGGDTGGVPLMFPKLQSLRLSENRLEAVPSCIHRQVDMCELTLHGNVGITRLPSKLHLLRELFFFTFDGISDPIVSELRSFDNTPEQLLCLRAREKNYCLNTSMRLFVIGHYRKGKSTVMAALRGTKESSHFDDRAKRLLDPSDHLTPEDRQSTVGIQCDKWICKKLDAATNITFYTWDFAGQEEYYLTHQCFFTNRALYLLVWNVEDGVEGIKSLTVWLQNLQAKAPGSSVIVVGTHLDTVPRPDREEKMRKWIEMIHLYKNRRAHSHLYPNIMEACFVGLPRKGKQVRVHGPDGLADCIFDVAMKMNTHKGPQMSGVRVKVLQERIPVAYERLRGRVDSLLEEARRSGDPPILPRDQFWTRVKEIEGLEEAGIEAAVDFLHASTGMILHFKLPHLVDYYIIDPQRWFDLCALVISPDNVSKLIRSAGFMARGNGQLETSLMDRELEKQGYSKNISNLIRQFLKEHGVIHQIDSENYLVPSAISPGPALPLHLHLGHFPFKDVELPLEEDSGDIPSSPYKVHSPKLSVVSTGLVYRRMLHLPPIASGFWSKLISLFIQHEEILLLISSNSPGYVMQVGTNRLRGMIGNVSVEWQYWKTGIMLIADDKLLMRVNSLRTDVFEDPQHQSVISSALSKAKEFQYQEAGEWVNITRHLSEVIEIVVPVAILCDTGETSLDRPCQSSVSAKLLAKALELVDEILKNHCEHLAMNGIYTVNDMLHLVPCPLCYGDSDHRVKRAPEELGEEGEREGEGGGGDRRNRHCYTVQPRMVRRSERPPLSRSITVDPAAAAAGNDLFTFRVDEVINQTMVSDSMVCPRHGSLEISHLAPDIAFADLAHMKLDRRNLSEPIDPKEPSNLRGSFAKVVKRTLNTRSQEGCIEVAIKIFVQFDSTQLASSATELAKNYADMRYELNKLSTMKHAFIVRFVGVFTNPLCFVLEWAPDKSLEHIRQAHTKTNTSVCPTSLFLTLLQVTDALSYLHEAVKIIHNDLRCSNILVFQFPPIGHVCLKDGVTSGCTLCLSNTEEACRVLVKVADMGICANPATQKTINKQGIRRFIPECLNFVATLTNKADIFSLGTCLYELMSLRSLPPRDMTEAEYKNMLMMGKRAGFSTMDPAYPTFLYQVLEECWQQEQQCRPPAPLLHSALTRLTGLSVRGGGAPSQTTQCLLLDSFLLHRNRRVSAVHSVVRGGGDSSSGTGICNDGGGGGGGGGGGRDGGGGGGGGRDGGGGGGGRVRVEMCAALSSLDEDSTSIMTLSLTQHHEEEDCRLEAKPLRDIRDNHVCAMLSTAHGEVLAALADGKVMIFNSTHSFAEPEKICSEFTGEHGEIVAMHYLDVPQLLVMGFHRGKVHVYSCPGGIRDSLLSDQKPYCTQLRIAASLHSLHCHLSPSDTCTASSGSVVEVWCGTGSSSVEVWAYTLTPSIHWVPGHVMEREETLISVCGQLVTAQSSKKFSIKQMCANSDSSCVVALLHQPGSRAGSLALIDAASKSLLRCLSCSTIPVSSLALSPTKLVLGTYEGLVHVFNWQHLCSGSSPCLEARHSETLHAHYKSVYSLICMSNGSINCNGRTSFCPTFVGKSAETVPREFLISVGYGRHSVVTPSKTTSSIFRSFTLQTGVCLHVWMI